MGEFAFAKGRALAPTLNFCSAIINDVFNASTTTENPNS
jgi:hypothetical protein